MDYQNVPKSIGAVISLKMATMHELDTVYGLYDVHNMLEIARVDAHNRRLLSKQR